MVVVETERPRILYKRPIDVPPLEPSEVPINVRQLRKYVYQTSIPRGDLRRGQVEALEETVRFFEQGGRVAYVEQASGYGKSRWMEEVGIGYGGRQVYVTSGETASNNIEDKLYGKKDLGRVDKDHQDTGHEVTIVTMQSLQSILRDLSKGSRRRIKEARFILDADLIFADELHHYLTPRGLGILSIFLHMNPKSIMLGGSATEGYNSIKNAEQQFGKCLHRVGLAEAVEEGVLISPHVMLVKTGVSLDNSRITPSGDFIFDASVPVRARDQKLLEAYLQVCKREGRRLRTISYLSTVEHAYEFAKLAKYMGIPADVIVGQTENRGDIYDKLEEGELATVATVATAIESLDLPWLDGTLHSAQTQSNRVARQMFPRSMRNIPGKKPPWIIQAVDDKTAFGRRPLVVPDILGQTRFVNGSVIVPKRVERNGSVYTAESAYEPGVEIPEGVGVNVEVIDINSLFRMSILGKAELLGKGLLPLSEVEKFRAQINDFLALIYKGEPVSSFAAAEMTSGLKIYDEVTQDEVSLASIIACTFDISTANLRAVHGNAFKEFLATGKLPQAEGIENIDIEQNQQDGNFVDPEFAALCAKFKSGGIADEEKRILAANIREMLEEQREVTSNSSILSSAVIDNPMLRASFFTLGRLLGVNSKSRDNTLWFSADSRDKLLEFVNEYSEEEPFGTAASKDTTIFIPKTHPQFGDVRLFLQKVFQDANAEGLNIKSTFTMNGYRILSDEFNGALPTLARHLGIPTRHGYFAKSGLRALRQMAGMED